jgi:hypothetical protein
MDARPQLRVVLSGSFHEQNFPKFLRIYEQFKELGAQILSPRGKIPINLKAECVRFLEEPPEESDEDVQSYHLKMIKRCTIHYTAITDGYVGNQTRKEIQRAHQLQKPRFCSEWPTDTILREITGWPATPEDVAEISWQIGFDGSLHSPDSLNLRRTRTTQKPPITH